MFFCFLFLSFLGKINIDELEKFLEGVNAGLQQKEIYATLKYLDIDGSGFVDKAEFLRQMRKAENVWKERFIQTDNAWGKDTLQRKSGFDKELMGGKLGFQPYSSTYNQSTHDKLKQIVYKMEDQSLNLNKFLQYISSDTG